MLTFSYLESPVLHQLGGGGGVGGWCPDIRSSHAWMHWHLTLQLQEFLNDIFSIIMFLFRIQLNNLSKFYVALKM